MKTRIIKLNLMFFSVVVALSSLAEPTVGRFLVRQQWPWHEKVEIEYTLSGVEGPTDVMCEVYDGNEKLEIPESSFSGERFGIDKNGLYRMSFDPAYAFMGRNMPKAPTFRLVAETQTPQSRSQEVLYKIFDIKNKTVEDVTRGALLNGEWGAIETNFGAIGEGYKTTLKDVLIWTGVTNDIAYKTSKLVLRKIPAGSFKGYKPGDAIPEGNNMTWSFDYWIGVFEITQAQRETLRSCDGDFKLQLNSSIWSPPGPRVIGDTLPEQYAQTYFIYGAPKRRNATSSGSDNAGFVNYLRRWFTKDGVCPYDFELPTQVQWMRAMRAGADSYYYDGIGKVVSEVTAEQFDALACNKNNGGYVTNGDGSVSTNIVAVGSFRPNAYGLYDMLGNVRELVRECGDNQVSAAQWAAGGVDVTGKIDAMKDYDTTAVGGSFNETGFGFATQQAHGPSSGTLNAGFRLCMQAMDDGISLLNKD